MIDVVIIHRNESSERENNLRYALSCYRKQLPNSKIILSETDTETDNEEIKKNVNIHLKIKSNSIDFCRALALNEGFKMVTADYVLFADNDCIIDESFFLNIENNIGLLDENIIIPYLRGVIYLTENETNLILENNKKFSEVEDIEHRNPIIQVGGVFLIKTEYYKNIGGFDPRFIGWGGEDDAFFYKAKHFHNILRLNYNVYHLYHHAKHSQNLGHEHFNNNVSMRKEYGVFNKEETIKKINEIGFHHLIS